MNSHIGKKGAVKEVRTVRREQGFTLIEVLASMVLLMILATVFIGFFTNGFQAVMKFGDRSEGLHETRQNIEGAQAGTSATIVIPKIGGGDSIIIHGQMVEEQIAGTSNSSMTVFIPTNASSP
ncbi:prepilin-type N-terminal cleavage/methylation domain-containing protein [Paenibacillus lentus]